jgi:hypothetical protein
MLDRTMSWQTGESAKSIRRGAPWRIHANRNIDTIDIGVPVFVAPLPYGFFQA